MNNYQQQQIPNLYSPQHQQPQPQQGYSPSNQQQQQYSQRQFSSQPIQQQQYYPTSPNPVIQNNDWIPSNEQSIQLNKWFSEIDITRSNRIGGKEAVFFLRRTSVPNPILSTIWMIIANGAPSVDIVQFYRIMRLVSLAASPIFSGAPPSLELYFSTKAIFVPLPLIAAPIESPTTNNIQPNLINNSQNNTSFINNNSPPVSSLYNSNHNSFQQNSPINQHNINVNVQTILQPVASVNQHYNVQSIITNNINNNNLNNKNDSNNNNSLVHQATNHVNNSSLSNNNIDDDEFSDFTSAIDSPLSVVIPIVNDLDLLKLSMISDDSNNNLAIFDIDAEEKNISNVVEDEEDFDDFVDANSVVKSTNLSSEFEIIQDDIIDQSSIVNDISSIINIDLSSAIVINEIKPINNDDDLLFLPVIEDIPSLPILVTPSWGDMSAFDELIETDLKIETEEWDDFEEGKEEEIKPEEIELKTDDLLLEEEVIINNSPIKLFQSNTIEISNNNQVENINDMLTNSTIIINEVIPTVEIIDIIDNNEDEFGDFGAFEGVEIDNKIDEVVINNDKTNDNEDEFGEFGDFEGVEIDITKDTNNLEVVHHDDFGDFGDATSFSPLDNNVKKDEIDFFPDIISKSSVSSSIVAPHVDVTHTSASVNDLLDFLDDSPPINTNNISSSVNDLLSIFPTEIKPLGVNIEEDFEACFNNNEVITTVESNISQDGDFGDFEGVEIENNNNNNFGDFGGFENAKIEDNSKNKNNTELNQSPQSPVKLKSFSLSELELMSLFLSEKHLYEDSYACIQHVNLLKKISEYSEEKKNALENDDLELAIKFKNKITIFSNKLASTEEENIWSNLIKSSIKGDKIEDIAELIMSLDSVVGQKFKRKYVVNCPNNNAPLEERIKFYVTAKRSSKLIIAIFTTHREHQNYWKDILNIVSNVLSKSITIIESYKKLNSADQVSISTNEKLLNYNTGVSMIAQLGLWLSATCIEALVLEDKSYIVAAQSLSYLEEAKLIWNNSKDAKVYSTPVADLIDIVINISPNTEVTYCNLTFRPLTIKKGEKIHKILECDSVRFENVDYLKAAINIWTNDISNKYPSSDGIFI